MEAWAEQFKAPLPSSVDERKSQPDLATVPELAAPLFQLAPEPTASREAALSSDLSVADIGESVDLVADEQSQLPLPPQSLPSAAKPARSRLVLGAFAPDAKQNAVISQPSPPQPNSHLASGHLASSILAKSARGTTLSFLNKRLKSAKKIQQAREQLHCSARLSLLFLWTVVPIAASCS